MEDREEVKSKRGANRGGGKAKTKEERGRVNWGGVVGGGERGGTSPARWGQVILSCPRKSGGGSRLERASKNGLIEDNAQISGTLRECRQ